MHDNYSQKIDQAIEKFARYAHMNVEEVRDFIYIYLEKQLKDQNHKEFDDENIEGVLTNTAQELNIPIDALKTKIYDILRAAGEYG